MLGPATRPCASTLVEVRDTLTTLSLPRPNRRHSWRPAHVHFKVRANGFHTLITQSYFEGGDYVDHDCCEGVHSALIHPDRREGGVRLIENDFKLAPAIAAQSAAAAD